MGIMHQGLCPRTPLFFLSFSLLKLIHNYTPNLLYLYKTIGKEDHILNCLSASHQMATLTLCCKDMGDMQDFRIWEICRISGYGGYGFVQASEELVHSCDKDANNIGGISRVFQATKGNV